MPESGGLHIVWFAGTPQQGGRSINLRAPPKLISLHWNFQFPSHWKSLATTTYSQSREVVGDGLPDVVWTPTPVRNKICQKGFEHHCQPGTKIWQTSFEHLQLIETKICQIRFEHLQLTETKICQIRSGHLRMTETNICQIMFEHLRMTETKIYQIRSEHLRWPGTKIIQI